MEPQRAVVGLGIDAELPQALDLLVGLMVGLCIAHAREAAGGYSVLFLGLLLGVATEWASLRFGGTH